MKNDHTQMRRSNPSGFVGGSNAQTNGRKKRAQSLSRQMRRSHLHNKSSTKPTLQYRQMQSSAMKRGVWK